jgi:hypothetical protein
VALVVSALVHATVLPVRTVPPPSSVAAVSCCVFPTITVAVVGVTVTVATGGGMTVSVADPVTAPTVAVTVVTPAVSVLTCPADVIDATRGDPVDHVTAPVANGALF